MPTGYTAKLADGEQSLEDFLKGCARGMGFMITMRDDSSDEPIPEKFEVGPYYTDSVNEKKARLAALHAMSDAEREAAASADFADRSERWEKRRADRRAQCLRYDAMIARVLAWTPRHEAIAGLKKFALEQLRTSREFDCSGRWDDKPKAQTMTEWYEAEIKDAESSLAYAVESLSGQEDRVAERNECLAEMRREIALLTEGSV